jgi:glucan phosphoethanolaminetransferase (alkaline phosphatase superfamily)
MKDQSELNKSQNLHPTVQSQSRTGRKGGNNYRLLHGYSQLFITLGVFLWFILMGILLALLLTGQLVKFTQLQWGIGIVTLSISVAIILLCLLSIALSYTPKQGSHSRNK